MDNFIILLMVFLIGFGVGVGVFAGTEISAWRSQAIERGYGEYCSTTGKWAWIGECEEQ